MMVGRECYDGFVIISHASISIDQSILSMVWCSLLSQSTDIPHFKQVIVMATSCDHCGHRSNEVKAGTGVSERGSRITLRLTDPSDLSRDILKVPATLHLSG